MLWLEVSLQGLSCLWNHLVCSQMLNSSTRNRKMKQLTAKKQLNSQSFRSTGEHVIWIWGWIHHLLWYRPLVHSRPRINPSCAAVLPQSHFSYLSQGIGPTQWQTWAEERDCGRKEGVWDRRLNLTLDRYQHDIQYSSEHSSLQSIALLLIPVTTAYISLTRHNTTFTASERQGPNTTITEGYCSTCNDTCSNWLHVVWLHDQITCSWIILRFKMLVIRLQIFFLWITSLSEI